MSTTSSPAAHPLYWPTHFARTSIREKGLFKTSLPTALANVERSLKNFAADSRKKIEGLVISSNFSLGVTKPADPGVSVWFKWDGLEVCIPVDRYQTIEANLQAIHHIIEARRTELRHGSLALVRATFMGFKALPAPKMTGDCWTILGIPRASSADTIKNAFREKTFTCHPDHGGSAEKWNELTTARDQALKYLAS